MPNFDYIRNRTKQLRSATRIQSVVRSRQTRTKVNKLKLAPVVAKLVDRRIDRKDETHAAGRHERRTQMSNLPDNSLAIDDRIQQIIPDIETDQADRGNREGSKITLKSLTIKGCLTIPAEDMPESEDRSDIMLRMCVLSSKKFKSVGQVRYNWLTGDNLFNKLIKPGASAGQPSGNNESMWQPINHDTFTVHSDKVYTFTRGIGLNTSPTPLSAGGYHMPSIHKNFNIRLKVKNKVLQYNTEGVPQPTNYQPFVVCWFSYTDGSAPSEAGVPFIEYWSQMYFKP